MSLYIWSDPHFLHANIISFCNRPFDNVEEMTEELIKRHNEIVGPDDISLCLGDFGFNYGSLAPIASRLNGFKQLVRGNHDFSIERMTALGFQCVTPTKSSVYTSVVVINGEEVRLTCAHRPSDLPTWSGKARDTWGTKNIILCGHEHDNRPLFIKWVRDHKDVARPVMALNMSCEHWNYYPAHLDKIAKVYDEEMAPYL